MPKVLVLFDDADAAASALGESAAEGARAVRFTEVDVRVPATVAGSRRKALESSAAIDHYDGVLFAVGNDSPTPALENVLAALSQASGGRFANIVFGAVRSNRSKLPAQLLALGGIVVGQMAAGDDIAQARALGARVAQVASWVRHSLAHEASEAHSGHHHPGHQHAH
jgi:hypothetical protein